MIDAHWLKTLKHELRTPINHIIGYSELLIETAEDRGEQDLADALRTVQRKGQFLTRALEEILPPSTDVAERDVERLRERFRHVLSTMLDAELLKTLSRAPDYAADVNRVRSATATLQAFSQGLEPGALPDPSGSAANV